MKVGENIREIREKEKKIKKEEIAKALGISTKAYSNIENNIAEITLTRLEEIAEILGCTPEYILNYKEKGVYTNNFNNYEGNHGVNIMYQGANAEQIQRLQKQLLTSEKQLMELQDLLTHRKN